MKTIKQFSVALVLILMLSLSAFAGIMETGAPSPATAPGMIHAHSDQQSLATSSAFADVALNLLQSVLLAF